jgi:hypothetical protein
MGQPVGREAAGAFLRQLRRHLQREKGRIQTELRQHCLGPLAGDLVTLPLAQGGAGAAGDVRIGSRRFRGRPPTGGGLRRTFRGWTTAGLGRVARFRTLEAHRLGPAELAAPGSSSSTICLLISGTVSAVSGADHRLQASVLFRFGPSRCHSTTSIEWHFGERVTRHQDLREFDQWQKRMVA